MSSPKSHPDVLIARLRSVGAADTLGRRLVLGREVGAGGMGRVFEAVDEATGRKLAVKLVGEVRGDAALARFAAEAEILEALEHPAIVAHVGHGTTPDGDPYLAMEWLDGEDLARRLARGPLPVADVAALGQRIASGLAAAHRAGIVHRDLKPSNVVLVEGDPARAALIDFGIARRAGADPMTRTGELLGTPGYMAPEQVRGRRDLDGRADLFSLGCVLYHGIAGRPPFEADEVMTVLARLLLEEPPSLRLLRPEVPPRLERLVARLLVKDPDERPASADAVAAELAAIARGPDATGPESSLTLAAVETVAQAPRRRRRTGPIAAIAGVAVIGAVPWLVRGPAQPLPRLAADATDDPDVSPAQARDLAGRMTAALLANPDARQLNRNEIELLPGVVVTLPIDADGVARGPDEAAPAAGAAACPDEHVCLYREHGYRGMRLRFDRCGTYNLYYLSISPGLRWHDEISSWRNAQADRRTEIYDWDGKDTWLRLFAASPGEGADLADALDEHSDLVVNCP